MAKTTAEKQKDYREWKKFDSDKLLKKERKRKKSITSKLPNLKITGWKSVEKLLKKECDDHELRRKALIEKIREDNESCAKVNSDRNFSPMMVSLQFPKRDEASRKRKRRSDYRLHKKIRKTPKRKTMKMMKNAWINLCNTFEIQKQLLFAETILKEIQEAVNEKKE